MIIYNNNINEDDTINKLINLLSDNEVRYGNGSQKYKIEIASIIEELKKLLEITPEIVSKITPEIAPEIASKITPEIDNRICDLIKFPEIKAMPRGTTRAENFLECIKLLEENRKK